MKTKIFHISTPFEQANTGDYDYGTAFVQALNAQGQAAEYVQAPQAGYDLSAVSSAVDLVNNVRSDPDTFSAAYATLAQDPNRKAAIARVKDYVLQKAQEESVVPILNLQLRPPETGFAFIPEDIEDFRRSGIKVNVTCHEYELNRDRAHLQDVLHGYFKAADSVTFFNQQDLDSACRREAVLDETAGAAEELRLKTCLSRVPPTVAYRRPTFEQSQERPPNLITFGIIRENKGFEEAIDIARRIGFERWPEGRMPRMIIAGKPASNTILSKILCAKFDEASMRAVMYENMPIAQQFLRRQNLDGVAEKYRAEQKTDKLLQDSHVQFLITQRIDVCVDAAASADTAAKKERIRRAITKRLVTQEGEIGKTEIESALSSSAISAMMKQALPAQQPLASRSISPHTQAIARSDYPDLQGNAEFLASLQQCIDTELQQQQEIIMTQILERQGASPTAFVNVLLERQGRGELQEQHPIDLCLDVPPGRMPELFAQAKYVVRIDNKGWANNASGHINAFANGCIVYTDHGMDTGNEVLAGGRYHGAIPFLADRDGLRNDSAHLAQKVLDNIHARESDGGDSNRATFDCADRLFHEQFEPSRIAALAKNQYHALTRREMAAALRMSAHNDSSEIEAMPQQGLYDRIDRVSAEEIEAHRRNVAFVDNEVSHAQALDVERFRSRHSPIHAGSSSLSTTTHVSGVSQQQHSHRK